MRVSLGSLRKWGADLQPGGTAPDNLQMFKNYLFLLVFWCHFQSPPFLLLLFFCLSIFSLSFQTCCPIFTCRTHGRTYPHWESPHSHWLITRPLVANDKHPGQDAAWDCWKEPFPCVKRMGKLGKIAFHQQSWHQEKEKIILSFSRPPLLCIKIYYSKIATRS